jgi:ABC-type Mn2+/Zn2+ transport system permease subunit
MGLYLSFYGNVASGGAIVLVSTTMFLLVLAYTSIRARLQPRTISPVGSATTG